MQVNTTVTMRYACSACECQYDAEAVGVEDETLVARACPSCGTRNLAAAIQIEVAR